MTDIITQFVALGNLVCTIIITIIAVRAHMKKGEMK